MKSKPTVAVHTVPCNESVLERVQQNAAIFELALGGLRDDVGVNEDDFGIIVDGLHELAVQLLVDIRKLRTPAVA